MLVNLCSHCPPFSDSVFGILPGLNFSSWFSIIFSLMIFQPLLLVPSLVLLFFLPSAFRSIFLFFLPSDLSFYCSYLLLSNLSFPSFFYNTPLNIFVNRLQLYSFELFHHYLCYLVYPKLALLHSTIQSTLLFASSYTLTIPRRCILTISWSVEA